MMQDHTEGPRRGRTMVVLGSIGAGLWIFLVGAMVSMQWNELRAEPIAWVAIVAAIAMPIAILVPFIVYVRRPREIKDRRSGE